VARLFDRFLLAILLGVFGVPLAIAHAELSPNGLLSWEDRRPLPWAAQEEFFLLVDRSCRTATLYRAGVWQKTYRHVVFGREDGQKSFEGDRRTPEGLYRIGARRHHPRWARFLLLDYPNATDRSANRRAVRRGQTNRGPGGEIGIHGTDDSTLNWNSVDWTLGCISLLDADVEDLYRRVPTGTPVWIRR